LCYLSPILSRIATGPQDGNVLRFNHRSGVRRTEHRCRLDFARDEPVTGGLPIVCSHVGKLRDNVLSLTRGYACLPD
jgi:hypothetical protein